VSAWLLAGALAALLGAGLVPDHPLSAHMAQHALIVLVAAPLLAAAAPVRILLRALPRGGRRAVGRALRSRAIRLLGLPVVVWALFTGGVLLTHLTGFFDAAARHPILHGAEHAVFLLTALPLWMVVLGRDPLPHRPGPMGRIALVLLAMPAMSAVGVVLATSDHLRYAAYAGPGALADQHTAGMLMWVGGTALQAVILLVAGFAALLAEERRQVARERRAAPAPGARA
jgi:putative membrane protein